MNKTLKRVFNLKDGEVEIHYTTNKAEDNRNSNDKLPLLAETLSNINSNELKKITIAYRLIIDDFNESELSLKIKGTENTHVKFLKGELAEFSKTESIEKDTNIKATYKKGQTFNCEIVGAQVDELIVEKIDSKNFILLSDYTKFIAFLIKDISKIPELNNLISNICKIYKVFYGENPNFKEKDIAKRIQTMLFILSYFNLVEDYKFTNKSFLNEMFDKNFEDAYLPISEEIENIIDYYIPPITLSLNEEDIKIDNKYKIEVIGNLIREATNNRLDELTKLCIILYSQEISNYPFEKENVANHYTKEEITGSKRLISIINAKINN